VDDWLTELEGDRPEAAWDAFLERYRGLLLASVRQYVEDHDDVMDAFTAACEGLRADGFRRLRAYRTGPAPRAHFASWLVTVARRLTVDWLRARYGRHRPSKLGSNLTDVQRAIHEQVFSKRQGHVTAYELIRSRDLPDLTFGAFLKELAAVYRATSNGARSATPVPAPHDPVCSPSGELSRRETAARLQTMLDTLPAADRLAVQMYVIDDLAAPEVARILGLANAKAVYNRVYRALGMLRAQMENAGLDRDDV
jgi:RNA polymerase sigma factor (sigma-70 family)